MQQINNQFFSIENLAYTGIKLTPYLIVTGFAGYYSLGVAYAYGIMAAIDRVAIHMFKHFFGYAGIGAFMPTFQWYSAWGVRISAAAIAGLLYNLIAKIVSAVIDLFPRVNVSDKAQSPQPSLNRPFSKLMTLRI